MKRKHFKKYYNLLPRQSWLADKENELLNLLSTCQNDEQIELVFSLLDDFQYINQQILDRLLESIVNYIINDTGFQIEKAQVVAMTMDDNPDSSQWILHMLKPILTNKGWNNIKCTTTFQQGVRRLNNENLNQLILVDEFIGSGLSVENRIKYLKKHATKEYIIKACFIAGMEKGIKAVSDDFADFKCFVTLKRGISDKFINKEKRTALFNMTELENNTLLPKINKKKLSTYHLGFKKTESLYSSIGNTPNSVFPLFWWPYNNDKNKRNPIFIRNEAGLEL